MPFQERIKQRQCRRTVSLNPIRYSIDSDSSCEMLLGTTLNISTGGICLYTLNHLEKGESIIIQDDDLLLSRRATVQWVKHYGEHFCKAGLMFIE